MVKLSEDDAQKLHRVEQLIHEAIVNTLELPFDPGMNMLKAHLRVAETIVNKIFIEDSIIRDQEQIVADTEEMCKREEN